MLEKAPKNRFPLNQARKPGTVRGVERLVDIAHNTKTDLQSTLEWVGMESVQMPLKLQWQGEIYKVPALVNCFVSLDQADAKGIHMSRLYELALEQMDEVGFTRAGFLTNLVSEMVQSQRGLSEAARVEVAFELPVKRKGLKSEKSGFRTYPLKVSSEFRQGEWITELSTEVLYSSTCPCSAALSRQLNGENFLQKFGDKKSVDVKELYHWLQSEESVVATPHAQRSVAEIQLQLSSDFSLEMALDWIDQVEGALKTPVQTAVKREDEQEFARLNATNLMFCEDAGRRLKALFESVGNLKKYQARVRHLESLHPHDAVAHIEG